MLGIDWSHTKGLAIASNEAVVVVKTAKSIPQDGKIAIEAGAPLQLLFELLRQGREVILIDGKAVKARREELGIEKTDETDAALIKILADEGLGSLLSKDAKAVKLVHCYARYLKNQKARITLSNIWEGHKRYFGDWISGADKFAYEYSLEQIEAAEHSCLDELERLSPNPPPTLRKLKGLGARLWGGIVATADPRLFQHQHQYLAYCGLTAGSRNSNKFSRKARVVYFLLSEQMLKQKNQEFRKIYDEAKQESVEKHERGECNCKYPKSHNHKVGMNRVSTALAKIVFDTKEEWSEQLGLWL